MISIFACTPTDKTLYKFDLTKLKENEMTLLEIAEDISYIPLDNSIPLNNIIPMKIVNDAIFLGSDIGILEFNKEGKFVGKIGKIGRGPGEYLVLGRFCVDDKSERIYVSDIKGVIKVFSGTGHFIRSFPLKEYGNAIANIEFFNSEIFVQYGVHADNEWAICDTLGNVIKRKPKDLPGFTTNWGGSQLVYKFGNRMSYYNPLADTVFSILPDLTEIPSFIIGSGEYRYPRSDLSLDQFLSGKYLSITNILETNHFFVIIYNYNKKHRLTLIDKHNQKSFLLPDEDNNSVIPHSGIINDIDGGLWFFPENCFTERGEEFMIGLQYPYQIKIWIESDEFKYSTPKYPGKKKALERLAASLKETDNPVLVLVRLKK